MRRRVPVVVVALAVSVFAMSCDSSVVQLRTETMGDTIEVTEDQRIELILEDNPRFDNANWEWIVVESGVVEHVSTDQVTRSDDEGAARTRTLTFTPVRIGTADLTLVYRQPGQADVEPDVEGVLSTLTITVTVTGTPNGSE